MNPTALHLPSRAEKPRDTGLTMVLDGGIPLWYFTDLVSSAASGISQENLLFEAPTTSLQTYFVTRIGPDANLGNVPVNSVIALETLRLGLRADTLTAFE